MSTRRCLSFADEPPPTPSAAHHCPRNHHKALVSSDKHPVLLSDAQHRLRQLVTTRLILSSVEFVPCGPCGRVAHRIKKGTASWPLQLALCILRNISCPTDASKKVLSVSSSQSSSALVMMRGHSAECATKPRMCLISFRTLPHQRVTTVRAVQ